MNLRINLQDLDPYNEIFINNTITINFLLEHVLLKKYIECRNCESEESSMVKFTDAAKKCRTKIS
jgi:hypothetical protein